MIDTIRFTTRNRYAIMNRNRDIADFVLDAMNMSRYYLKLAQSKILKVAELVTRSLNVDVTVVDTGLSRIAGTGGFREYRNTSPHNSIFARVLTSGEPVINVDRCSNATCRGCTEFSVCVEKCNITYPIRFNRQVVGVVSFASFSESQRRVFETKEPECVSMLQYMVGIIESELAGVERSNKIINHNAEINEVINCIDKGIIIIGRGGDVIHINSAAVENLRINTSEEVILNRSLVGLIGGVSLGIPENMESLSCWSVKGRQFKVLYKINKIILDGDETFVIITFDTLEEMISRIITYQDKSVVRFSSIIGGGKLIQKSIEMARVAAGSDSTVLLSGESGTGKELFARSIHNESYRHNGPFVAINCASMPEPLIESELFGYAKGAFTGANPGGKIGKFEAAMDGTLFLDEISELPYHLQAKLLRVLQEKSVDPVGGVRSVPVNARIIAATNRDIGKLVSLGLFRLDLYYRINTIHIPLPPLRDRPEDILPLARYVLKKTVARMNRKEKVLGEDVEQLLASYEWPGNTRELENVIEYAVVFCPERIICVKYLPDYLTDPPRPEFSKIRADERPSFRQAATAAEREAVEACLREYGDSVEGKRRAAEKLGISLATLYRKISILGLGKRPGG